MFPETVATLPDINICNYEGVVYTTALILLMWGWMGENNWRLLKNHKYSNNL